MRNIARDPVLQSISGLQSENQTRCSGGLNAVDRESTGQREDDEPNQRPTIVEYTDRARPASSVPLIMARPSLNSVISYGGEEHFKRKSLNWTGPNAPMDFESSLKLRSPFTPGIS